MDNGYGTVDFAGGQPKCENCTGEYKLRSVFKLYAELHSDEFADNWILKNQAPRRKAGSFAARLKNIFDA